jgi:hypothetical protein
MALCVLINLKAGMPVATPMAKMSPKTRVQKRAMSR